MTSMPTYADAFSSFTEIKTGTIGFDSTGAIWNNLNGTWTKVATATIQPTMAAAAPPAAPPAPAAEEEEEERHPSHPNRRGRR